MLSHCFVGVNDFEAALRFYRAIFEVLGHPLRFCDRTRPWAGWQPADAARPLFLIEVNIATRSVRVSREWLPRK